MELMKSLSARNQFQYHKDGVQKVEKIKMTFSEEVSLGTLSLNYDFHPQLMDNTVETPIIMDSFQCRNVTLQSQNIMWNCEFSPTSYRNPNQTI